MARGQGSTIESINLDYSSVERFGLSSDHYFESYRNEVFDEVEVAALTYRTDWETVQQIPVGGALKIERDPKNEKDPNAIKVFFKNEEIGMIDKTSASQISPLMDSGATAILRVTSIEEPYHQAHRNEGNFRYKAGRVFGRVTLKIT
jgi:hypothetical protein